MSLSAYPVPPVLVDDPRIDLDDFAAYVVERGAAHITYRKYQSDNSNNSSISFNTLVPSRSTVVASKVHVQVPITVVCTRVTADGVNAANSPANLNDADFALRFGSLIQACSSIQMNLNGKTFSEDIGYYYEPLMRFCNTREENAYDFSTFNSRHDMYGEYYVRDDINARTPINFFNAQTQPDGQMTRVRNDYDECSGSTLITEVADSYVFNNAPGNGNPKTLTFTMTLDEIIPLSPLFWGHKNVKGLVGLDTFNLQFNLDPVQLNLMVKSQLDGVMNNGAGNPYNNRVNIAVTIGDKSHAEFIYLKPRDNIPIPPVNRYPYSNIKRYITECSDRFVVDANGARVPNNVYRVQSGDFTQTFNNIQLAGIPKRIYIYISQRRATMLNTDTDTYARINNISLNIGDRSGIMAECSPYELYRMSVKNGLKLSWDKWYNRVGSVLCLDFGTDIPLDISDAPGTLRQLQFYFTVKWNAIQEKVDVAGVALANRTVIFDCNAIVCYDGMVTITDGQVLMESNNVNVLDVLKSEQLRKIPYDALDNYTGGMYGSGTVSKLISEAKSRLGRSARKLKPYVDKYAPMVGEVAKDLSFVPGASAVGDIAKLAPSAISALAGMGYSEEQIYALLMGAKKGGKIAPKKQLKARAMK